MLTFFLHEPDSCFAFHLGANERDSCYSLMLNTIECLFPCSEERHNVQILVTGAGLARFAWELLQKGFSVQGNE